MIFPDIYKSFRYFLMFTVDANLKEISIILPAVILQGWLLLIIMRSNGFLTVTDISSQETLYLTKNYRRFIKLIIGKTLRIVNSFEKRKNLINITHCLLDQCCGPVVVVQQHYEVANSPKPPTCRLQAL